MEQQYSQAALTAAFMVALPFVWRALVKTLYWMFWCLGALTREFAKQPHRPGVTQERRNRL